MAGERFGVCAALVAGLALRLHTIAAANAWWDESLAIWAVRKGLAGVTAWTAGDVHPPLYFWQLAVWVALVGEAEFASRALTALTGVVLIATAYVLGRRAGGRAGGLAAAWLAALAPLLVWWSMELRMYTSAGLFVALALALALRWHAGVSGSGALVGYAVCAWAALHTVYLSAAGVALVALAILAACWSDSARRRTWLAAQVAVVLASLPWFAYALPRMSSWSSMTEPATLAFTTRLWLTLLATGHSAGIDAVWRATVAFWIAAGLAAVVAVVRGPWRPSGAGRPHQRVAAACMSLFLIVPPLVVWMATQPRSLFYSPGLEARYFVPFAAPALALAAASAGAAWRAARPAAVASALVMLLVGATALPAYYADRRWHDGLSAMAGAIWSQARDGDGVLLVSGNRYPLFRHVYDRRAPPGSAPRPFGATRPPAAGTIGAPDARPPVYEIPEAGGGRLSEYEWQGELERLMKRHDRLWLVEIESHLQDQEGDVEKWLAARRPRVLAEGYGPDALHLFAEDGRAPDGEGPAMPGSSGVGGAEGDGAPARADERAEFVWTGPVAPVAQPGDQVNLAVASHRRPEQVSLVGTDGVVAMQADWVSAAGGAARSSLTQRSRTRYRAALDISPRIPEGEYALVSDATCGVRRADDDSAPRAPDTAPAGDGAADCLRLHVRGSEPRTRMLPVTARFGTPDERLPALNGIGRAEVRPGRTVPVDLQLNWPAGDGSGRSANEASEARDSAREVVVFAHLLGPTRADGGTVWAGDDVSLGGGPPDVSGRPAGSGVAEAAPRLTRLLLVVPSDLPAGAYEIEVGLYDRQTGERFEVTAVQTPDGRMTPANATGQETTAIEETFAVDRNARRLVQRGVLDVSD
jgi:hypothetical protein